MEGSGVLPTLEPAPVLNQVQHKLRLGLKVGFRRDN